MKLTSVERRGERAGTKSFKKRREDKRQQD